MRGGPLVLAGVFALHALVLPVLFPAGVKRPEPPSSSRSSMLVMAVPLPAVRPRIPPTARTGAPLRAKPATPGRPLSPASPAPSDTVRPEPGLVPTETPEAAGPLPDTLTAARNAAGMIDRQLRKESRDSAPVRATPMTGGDRFAAAISSAQVHRGAIRMEDFKLNDGRTITRVIGPLGVYCMAMQSNANAALDPARNGVMPVKVPCPH